MTDGILYYKNKSKHAKAGVRILMHRGQNITNKPLKIMNYAYLCLLQVYSPLNQDTITHIFGLLPLY